MKNITFILLIIVSNFSYANNTEWSMHLQTISGWGNKEGAVIHSSGKHGLATGLDEAKIKYCTSSKISIETLKLLQEALFQIPKEIPNNAKLHLIDNCSDEVENLLIIKEHKIERYFQYSKMKKCLKNKEIPQWLSGIVDTIWKEYESFKDCKTKA